MIYFILYFFIVVFCIFSWFILFFIFSLFFSFFFIVYFIFLMFFFAVFHCLFFFPCFHCFFIVSFVIYLFFQCIWLLFIVFQCFSLCFIVFKWCSLFFIIIFSLFFNVFNLFWLSVFHLCSVLHYVSIVFQNSPGHNNWSALKWQKFNKFPRFFFDDLHLIPFIVSQCSTEYVSVFSKFLGTVNLRVAICPPPLLDPMHNMWSREKQHITTNSLKILGQTRSPSSHKCSLHGPAVPAL